MKKIKFKEETKSKFELVIQVRDHAGNPTGRTKSFTTDNVEELDNFWNRNIGINKSKAKKADKTNKKNKKEEKEN